MSATCLACNPSRISYSMVPRTSSSPWLVSPLSYNRRLKDRKYMTSFTLPYNSRSSHMTTSSAHASFRDMAEDSLSVFPRIHVKDPYKRLGISREASEEEIQAARNYLVKKYAGHKPSIDAIESAHNKILLQSFYDRRTPKINLEKKVREVTQSHFVQAVASRFQTPSKKVILKTAIAFIALGALTVLFPTEDGPTLQVAISLVMSIYFIYDRLRSTWQAVLYGIGSFFASWLVGTFLMVSMGPILLQGPRSLEVSTSMLSYILLWISSTYLK